MCFMHLIGCRILLTLCTDFVLFSWESVICLVVMNSDIEFVFDISFFAFSYKYEIK